MMHFVIHSINTHIFYMIALWYHVEYDSVLALMKIKSVVVLKNKTREKCERGLPNLPLRKNWIEKLTASERR